MATTCRPIRLPATARRAPPRKPYDGGEPTGAPDRKGKKITVVDVPKLIGIGYFNATSKGIADAAEELGNVDAKTDGPTQANIDQQITFIDNYITSGVDGILFAANDPVAIAPVLKKALSKGINVVGYDANSTPDARQWFVNQAEFNGIAKAMVDNMAKEIGEEGSLLSSPRPSPRPTRRAGSPRWGPMPQVPSQDEVARDRRSAGRQCSFLQPGDDAHQQIWR